ncbi:unnamed protein product [Rotaria magnacalcarata]|uniref:Uncharacterized protein n=3 Tax=Rotaria magnacalcarata TaxID=392030 RepID=A0A814D8Y8_9BILA|nr:unnamed protein product [Rotaria magnacalcarata]CAF3956242.1 unnamed protein product [Rotaria magnacalcarata]
MSHLSPTSAVSNVWSAAVASTVTDPTLQNGKNPIALSMVNNSNFPTSTTGNFGNSALAAPFSSMQLPLGPANSLGSNLYATAHTSSSFYPNSTNLVQNPAESVQNDPNNRRLTQLEDESAQRSYSAKSVQQIGAQLLLSQMDVQEQVLQYQFMLEQCMETLDYQNFILNGQTEELTFLRSRLHQCENIMNTIKQMKKNNPLQQKGSKDSNQLDINFSNIRNPLPLREKSNLPIFNGSANSSQFQPANQRYQSIRDRSSNLNRSQSMTPSFPNIFSGNAQITNPLGIFSN